MFNVGGGELIAIMVLALIVLGPQRLPTAARQVGKALGDLRRLSSGFQNEVRSAFDDVDDPERIAARRNVLAKETRAVDGPATDEAVLSAPADGGHGSVERTAGRPRRREPLRATAADAPSPTSTATNGTRVKTAETTAARKPAAVKSGAAKQTAATKAGAKEAPSKTGAKRTSS